MTTTLFLHIIVDSKFKTSLVPSSQSLLVQWLKSLSKYMVQLSHKIIFICEQVKNFWVSSYFFVDNIGLA